MSDAPRILITSGPTREYLDPVRFLSNASSGQMGAALAGAVLKKQLQPVVVSGPVSITYPTGTELHLIETTDQMLRECQRLFPDCLGAIGAAAPCDYKPLNFSEQKLSKTGRDGNFALELVETTDILASLGEMKRADQWLIAFALETENGERNAMEKLKRKNCDFVALNSPASINNFSARLQIFDAAGILRTVLDGNKTEIAKSLIELILSDKQ